MLELIKFECKCKKCHCFNSVFLLNNICAECIYGKHECPRT